MINTRDILFELSRRVSVGNIHSAAEFAAECLRPFAEVEMRGGSVIGKTNGKSNYTILLDAHIDQVAFTVTEVDGEGFLTVAPCGGIDLRALPARTVTVHGKKAITAVFCSTPPHLSSGETEYSDISKIKLDTCLGEKASELVSLGDYVTFTAEPAEMGGLVTGCSLDNRAGVACLIKTAELLSAHTLPCKVVFLFSDAEELGLRGAATAAYGLHPDEALVVDVTFGDGLGIPTEECKKLGEGAMIGFSPVLDGELSKALCATAEKHGIKHGAEVMSGRTGTNADVLSTAEGGCRTATVSIPLRNMHSEVEAVSPADIEATARLLAEYILSGGLANA